MRPEALLASLAVVVLIATVALAVLVPGFVAEPEPDDPPARLDVTETTLEIGEITGETVTFDVTAFVRHRGGPAENVSVEVRAVDGSGVLVATASEERQTFDANGEHRIPLSVTVPREGSYTIRTILYVDGERTGVAEAKLSGVEGLTPPHAHSTVEFHRFPQQPSVEYTIESVDDGTVTLVVTGYLTNTGDSPEAGIRVGVTARHAEAGVVADRTATDVGEIDPGRTETVETTVTVPDESNYYLDVTLWRDGVVIDSTRAAANLDPRRQIDVDERTEAVAFDAGEFETTRGDGPPEPRPEAEPDDQAGFGPAVAVVALMIGVVAARRWS